jgi:hypothetical protein
MSGEYPKAGFWLRVRAAMAQGSCLGEAIYLALLSYRRD